MHRANRDFDEQLSLSRTAQLLLALVLVPLTLATALGLFLLWPDGPPPRAEDYQDVERVPAVVTAVHPCPEWFAQDFGGQVPEGCRSATARLEHDEERTVEAAVPYGSGAPDIEPGDRVVLFEVPDAPPSQQWQVIDFDRGRAIYSLVAVFVVALLALSRWRGVASLASLAVSLAVVIWFVLPNLLAGASPLLIAVVAASAIMIVALYLGHGFSAMTSAALVGTLISLALTGALGAWFTSAARFTGFSDESTGYLAAIQGDINYQGLVLAALIIGSLGVLDDVTVTQSAAVWELKAADPTASRRALFSAAMRIGRAHVSAAVNTLVLAYVSAMLPLLLFLTLISTTFNDALLGDAVAQEIVRGLVGSLGIIAAVPITTLVAVLVAASGGGYARAR